MDNIRMVDLVGQYNKIKQEVDTAVLKVIESSAYINGPEVKSFQQELETYLGVKHVIPCGNGTDALQVSMMALGLQPGDEVITTSFTFVATVEVIALLGLKPVMVDVCPDTFNILPEEIEKAITSKTKAIVPVHLFGQTADMDSINKIAEKYNLFVIEDNCQAIGSEYTNSNNITQKAGTIGTIGCTSFFPSKNLGAMGDGGAIFTNNDDYALQLRNVVNHGMERRYYHDYVGVNSRLDSIQAAVLRIKLKHLDEYIAARQKAGMYYSEKLSVNSNIQVPKIASFTTHVFHQYTLKILNGKRDKLLNHLQEKNIPCAVYYPVPLHLQKAYRHYGYKEGDLPVTEQLSHEVISLPMHTELTQAQQDYMIEAILNFV